MFVFSLKKQVERTKYILFYGNILAYSLVQAFIYNSKSIKMIKNQQYLNNNTFGKSSIVSQNRASQTFRKLIKDQNTRQLSNSYSLNSQYLKCFNSQSNLKVSQNFSYTRLKRSASKIENLKIDAQHSVQPVSQSYKFQRAKSHSYLRKEVAPIVSTQKQKQNEEQDQPKTPYFQKQKLTKVKSMGSNLVFSKCLDKIATLNQKTQQSKQLCFEIKRKIFKETFSTAATTPFRYIKALCLKDFKLGQRIRKEKFSQILIARHIFTGIIVAIKIINKQTIKRANFIKQILLKIKIQSFFTHPNIIKLYGLFNDSINLYIVQQYCWGDQLYDTFNTKKILTQQDWVPIMKGICEGILQLHNQEVIHRDIKPENIIMSFGMPKIGYFGSSIINSDFKRQFSWGTILYISPELLTGRNYGKQIDVWALGIMMYEFLTGKTPFKMCNEENMPEIVNRKVFFPNYLSPNCLNLLNSMLNKNQRQRITIKNILSHPFLNTKTDLDPINFKISKQK